ncbi:MAG TPA: outer membrane protein assembly factor BamE [Novimethylophilus sp.]|jgi:outer membrane protein assembly factor BamE|uniref:outer membrane protein assembly factor BamE n=1 Tax=Novimethylophilus sp. TaxID=2137426 RepID=UPI002F41A360
MRYPTILLALFCVACGSYSANVPTIKPYKMDIQQGNVVTPKMMMQLRPGMTKSQVRFIMGTPLLVDGFHTDRWDYFYQMRKEGRIIEQRRVILEFEGDTLAHVRGDVVPAGPDASARPAAAAQPEPVPAKTAPKEKGLLDKLKFWDGDEQAAPKAQPEAAEQAKAKPAPTPTPTPGRTAPDESAAKAAPTEAPLPPLMDEAMQPKPQPVQTAPQAQTQQPAAKSSETKSSAETKPREEKRGLLDKLKFWGDDDKPKAATVPASKPVDVSKVGPGSKAIAAEKAPAAKSQPQAESRAMIAPQPPKDLPPEDSPDFFEKMLEKIGF